METSGSSVNETQSSKKIVLCSDGTGNQDIKNRGTNVFKLYEAVDIHGHKTGKAPRQVAFYDDGVGTSRIPLVKLAGGAFGYGFSHNVQKMYRELVNVYEPGDELYLFGFSRGAYTVRTLAAMIQYCGILDINDELFASRANLSEQIQLCWNEFRSVNFQKGFVSEKAHKALRSVIPPELNREERTLRRKRYHAIAPEADINIELIGVWDTVGAVGAPIKELLPLINLIYPIWFADNTLGSEVKKACQALSIDDERLTFHPELWNEQDKEQSSRITQVWFAGVHSNVGGGYPKQGMSLVTLDWMMEHAKKAGLHFIGEDRTYVRDHQDVHDKLYDSRSGMALYYRWMPRNIQQICQEHLIGKPKIHISVFERIANATNSYAPGNIPFDCTIDTFGGIHPWPTPDKPKNLLTVLAPQPGTTTTSLLAEMKPQIALGKRTHIAFVMVTAAMALSVIVACLLYNHCCLTTLVTVGIIFVALYLAAGFIIYKCAGRVDKALVKTYSQFWHDRRTEMRNILRK
jgi:uncharacterized protein (DUF2235 family)